MLVPSYLLLAALSGAVVGSPFLRRHHLKRQHDNVTETISSRTSSRPVPSLAIIPMDPTTIYSIDPAHTFVNPGGQPIATVPGVTIAKTNYIPYTEPSVVNLFPSTSSSSSTSSSTSSSSTTSLTLTTSSSSSSSSSPSPSSSSSSSSVSSFEVSMSSSNTGIASIIPSSPSPSIKSLSSTFQRTRTRHMRTSKARTSRPSVSATPSILSTASRSDKTTMTPSAHASILSSSAAGETRSSKSQTHNHFTNPKSPDSSRTESAVSSIASSVLSTPIVSAKSRSSIYSPNPSTSDTTATAIAHSHSHSEQSSRVKPGHGTTYTEATNTALIESTHTPSADSSTARSSHVGKQSKPHSSLSDATPTNDSPKLKATTMKSHSKPSHTSIFRITQTSTIRETVYATHTRPLHASTAEESERARHTSPPHESKPTQNFQSIHSTVMHNPALPSSISQPPLHRSATPITSYTLEFSHTTHQPHFRPVVASGHTFTLVVPASLHHKPRPIDGSTILTTIVVQPPPTILPETTQPYPSIPTSQGTIVTLFIPDPTAGAAVLQTPPPEPAAPETTAASVPAPSVSVSVPMSEPASVAVPAPPGITIQPVEIKGFVTVTKVEQVVRTTTAMATVTERCTETVMRTVTVHGS